MQAFNAHPLHLVHRQNFSGHLPTQSTRDFGRSDRLTHPLSIKILNTPWQLIPLKITFAIKIISNLSLRRWITRSAWVKMTKGRGENE